MTWVSSADEAARLIIAVLHDGAEAAMKFSGAVFYLCVFDGEISWGQDRLEFLDRALKQQPSTKGV